MLITTTSTLMVTSHKRQRVSFLRPLSCFKRLSRYTKKFYITSFCVGHQSVTDRVLPEMASNGEVHVITLLCSLRYRKFVHSSLNGISQNPIFILIIKLLYHTDFEMSYMNTQECNFWILGFKKHFWLISSKPQRAPRPLVNQMHQKNGELKLSK